MSRESAALNVDSVLTLPNGMVLGKLESSGASPSIAASMVNNVLAMSAEADSKETLPVAGLADDRINFGLGYNSQPVIVNLNAAHEGNEQPQNTGVVYLKRCNGMSGSSGDQWRVDSPKRQTNQNQPNRGWPAQNEQPDGRGKSLGRLGRSTEPKTNTEAALSRRNDTKWTASSEKRINSHEAQRQNLGEKKSVKILQRPSSVTKIFRHDAAEQGNLEGDALTAAHQKKGRKKTLSLNPDELEDLEILIEQVLKDGIEETNTDSEDDDDIIETVGQGSVNEERKASPEKLSVIKNLDKTEREAKMEVAKNTVIRNETGARGRKFVKETGKNVGRGRDQGRRRENPKTNKDNHRLGNFQPRRVNEVSPPAPALVEDDKAKQNMMNVYPAQLKVALKHMDSLPPRFQRRLQSGMSQISGSDPALSKLMEEISPPTEGHGPSFGVKDGDKSREKGSKKSIRNLLTDLALYDEETSALPASDSFPRRLSYSSGVVSERGKSDLLNAPLQVSNTSANGAAIDPRDKSMNIGDPFRLRPSAFPQAPVDKMDSANGAYVSDRSATDSLFGYANNVGRWSAIDRSAAASPLPEARKTTFSVNAPAFVSTLFPLFGPSSPGGDSRESHHAIPDYLEGVDSLGFANDANQMLANQPLSSNVINYRNNMVQPEYVNVSVPGRPAQFPMIPGMPVNSGRNVALDSSFGPIAPSGANFSPRQRFVGMNMVPYAPVPMPYDAAGRGYVPQQQVFMPALSGQQYGSVQMSDQQMTTVAGDLTPMQWFAGGGMQGSYMSAASSQMDTGMGSGGGGVGGPYGGRMGSGGWPSKAFIQQPLPFEAGRQRMMRLLAEGNFVMVILVGCMDGNKLSMFSELQSNSAGSFILNLRNGICPSSDEKILELHQWNYKQALEAVEAQKNPIIIDHPFAQQWQLQDYVRLGHTSSYFVEIVDCYDGGQFRGIPNMSSYVWDEWRPNVQPPPAVDERAPSVGLNRYNIPSVMNSVYYLPSASAPTSMASPPQPPAVAHGDQAASSTSSSMQGVLLPVPNM